jgi:hypothetical protein
LIKLFNTDLAKVLYDAMGRDLLDGSLTKYDRGLRDPNALTSGTKTTTQVSYAFKGFIEAWTSATMIENALVRQNGESVSMLGKSFPESIIPEIGDAVSIEDKEYTIIRVSRDPAGAMYVCEVQGI